MGGSQALHGPAIPLTNAEVPVDDNDALQGVWRRAFADPDGASIKCASVSEAKRVRFLLYNAVREARKPDGMADEELREAVRACSVSFGEGDPTTVVVRQKMRTGLMEKILAAAGEYVKPQAAANESAARVMEKLKAEGFDFAEGRPKGRDEGFVYNPPWLKGKAEPSEGGGESGNAE